jgi:antibiotic biosynthesis monooxygenase (ABM) superfamily enzyme
MSGITRRNLMRNSALTATSSLLPASLAGAATSTTPSHNVFHVFAFQWNPEATDAQKEKATHDIRAFQGSIPGLLETHVGPNISPRGKGYTFGGIMRFTDQAALDAYVKHPSHQALLVWLVPLINAIELDLNA